MTAQLTKIKAELGIEPKAAAERTLELIESARSLMRRMEEASRLPESERQQAMQALAAEARAVNSSRVYKQTDFVSWGGSRLQLKPLGLARLMVELFVEEIALTWVRWTKRRYEWAEAGGVLETTD